MKNISEMNAKELLRHLMARPNLNETIQILEEAYKKNAYLVMQQAVKDEFLMETPELSDNVLNYISLKQNGVGKNLLSFLLSHSPEIINTYPKPKLTQVCLTGHSLPATALISKNTPGDIIAAIISQNDLMNPVESSFMTTNQEMAKQLRHSSPILTEIVRMIKGGWKWENQQSALALSSRLMTNYNDKFMTEISTGDLEPGVAMVLLESLENKNVQKNTKLINNLSENENEGVAFARLIKRTKSGSNEEVAREAIQHLEFAEDQQEIQWLWDYIMERRKTVPSFDIAFLF